MSLENLKCKLITLREKIHTLESDAVYLDIDYDRVVREKNELEVKFEKITLEVKKNAEM